MVAASELATVNIDKRMEPYSFLYINTSSA